MLLSVFAEVSTLTVSLVVVCVLSVVEEVVLLLHAQISSNPAAVNDRMVFTFIVFVGGCILNNGTYKRLDIKFLITTTSSCHHFLKRAMQIYFAIFKGERRNKYLVLSIIVAYFCNIEWVKFKQLAKSCVT
jgi:hypothetical protein